MGVFQAIFLGLLQGLTEFLPISSSGHLVIGQKLLGLNQPPVFFDILVHLGTLLAVVFYFNKRIIKFYQKFDNLKLIFFGTLPVALLGFFLNDYLETIFDSLLIVGLCLVVNAALLFSTLFIREEKKQISQLNSFDSLPIGCLQALALLPGISRSGSTIVAGLRRQLKRESAFAFSFYLGAPAMLGAAILQIPEMFKNSDHLATAFIGLVTAFMSGLISLKMLEKIVFKGKLFYFGAYCLVLGLLLLF
jgi:undecaprenyl-diphosphatase